MRTLSLSILVPVVVILAWGLLFLYLDRVSAAQSRAELRRAEDAARRRHEQGGADGGEVADS
jgi:hypothetical protein